MALWDSLTSSFVKRMGVSTWQLCVLRDGEWPGQAIRVSILPIVEYEMQDFVQSGRGWWPPFIVQKLSTTPPRSLVRAIIQLYFRYNHYGIESAAHSVHRMSSVIVPRSRVRAKRYERRWWLLSEEKRRTADSRPERWRESCFPGQYLKRV